MRAVFGYVDVDVDVSDILDVGCSLGLFVDLVGILVLLLLS